MPSHAALIRHGHYVQPPGVPSALLPHPLTEEGEGQALHGATMVLKAAQDLGLTLHPVIDTSVSLRAFQTGTLMAEALSARDGKDYRIEEFDALCERSVGCAANLTLQEIEAVIEKDPRYESLPERWKERSEFRLPLPGAESLIEAGERVARHLHSRLENLDSRTLKLFVGHGASFRHAMVVLGGFTLEEARAHSMFHAQPVCFEVAPRWRRVHGEWKVRSAKTPTAD